MSVLKTTNRLELSALLIAAAFAANAERMADGIDWIKSSEDMQVAYILGLSNALSAGYQYDEKHSPGREDTFSHRAVQGLGDITVFEAVKRVDAWYKAHPDQLMTPVLRVLWIDIAKPRLTTTK